MSKLIVLLKYIFPRDILAGVNVNLEYNYESDDTCKCQQKNVDLWPLKM